MSKIVYHASFQSGLSMITPGWGVHDKEHVYASYNKDVAALFLSGFGGDDYCHLGTDEEYKPFIKEVWPGAFKARYADRKGSIYSLPADTFIPTGIWEAEVKSKSKVAVIDELVIDNIIQYFISLVAANRLNIHLL